MKTIILPEKTVHAGNLILVNAQHAFHAGIEECRLVPVNKETNGVFLERRAAALLSGLMNGIDGWAQISAVSGWRSKREQEAIFDQSLKENGPEFTEKFVAKPDCSEHQTGLAIDLGLKKPQIDFIRPDFPYSGICQTFREKAIPYGFIERYPQGKEDITGITHEPWHFRYVGAPHAAIMTKMSFTLEEYLSFLKDFAFGKRRFDYQTDRQHVSVSYVETAGSTDTAIEINADIPYSVSGNNVDGFVLTEWRNGNVER